MQRKVRNFQKALFSIVLKSFLPFAAYFKIELKTMNGPWI